MNRKQIWQAMAFIAAILYLASPAVAAYDLEVTQVVSASTIQVGEEVTFTITATNNGPDISPSDFVFEFYAAGLSWEFISATRGEVETDGNNRFERVVLPPLQLAAAESTSFEVILRAVRGGALETVASVWKPMSPEPDSDYTNNGVSNITKVLGDAESPVYDLELTYSSSTQNVQPGGLLVLDLHVKNNGPEACRWPIITFLDSSDMPWGDMDLLAVQHAGGWEFEKMEEFFTCTFPSLPAGDISTISVIFQVQNDPNLELVKNEISVNSHFGSNLNDMNSHQSIAIPVADNNVSGTDMKILPSLPSEVTVNQPFTYAITAVNRGPNPAPSAYVGNLVPETFRVISVSSDKGAATAVGNYVALKNAPLAVGEAATIQITVEPQVIGTTAAVGGVLSDDIDPNPDNNLYASMIHITGTGQEITPIPCAGPDLVSEITGVKRKGKFKKKHSQWQYTIQTNLEVSNLGTECAPKAPVWFYLSHDTVLDASDTLIGGKPIEKICPGKKKKMKFKTQLPMGFDPVNYYVIVVADGENLVTECDETNNWSVRY